MNSLKLKKNTGVLLVSLFIVTLTTGIILHLKSHGMIVEPRAVIKVIHWSAGLSMVIAAGVHGRQWRRSFVGCWKRNAFSGVATGILILFICAAALTGIVKLASPVKIHGLGLWHYWIGMLMSLFAVIHLIKGIPVLRKMIRAGRHG